MALSFQTSELLRFISGFTAASIAFKDNFSSVLALSSIATTGGIAAGPPLGGLLYEVLGYPGPFCIIGAVVVAYGAWIVPCYGFQFEVLLSHKPQEATDDFP